jgi:hypothetical protein
MTVKRGDRILSITAIISLLLACFFLSGYAGRFGPQLLWISNGPPKVARFVSCAAERGQAEIFLESFQWPLPGAQPWLWHGIHFDFLMSTDTLKRVRFNTSFEFRSIPTGTPGPRVYLAACPIWCATIPCLIAPALWLRRRRRRSQRQVGFPIEAIEK